MPSQVDNVFSSRGHDNKATRTWHHCKHLTSTLAYFDGFVLCFHDAPRSKFAAVDCKNKTVKDLFCCTNQPSSSTSKTCWKNGFKGRFFSGRWFSNPVPRAQAKSPLFEGKGALKIKHKSPYGSSSLNLPKTCRGTTFALLWTRSPYLRFRTFSVRTQIPFLTFRSHV